MTILLKSTSCPYCGCTSYPVTYSRDVNGNIEIIYMCKKCKNHFKITKNKKSKYNGKSNHLH
jgi:transposase-like protein